MMLMRALRLVLNFTLILISCSPCLSSSMGGAGTSVILGPPLGSQWIPPKGVSTTHRHINVHDSVQQGRPLGVKPIKSAVLFQTGVSVQSGSGHSVIAQSIPAQYYTGYLYLAPWGADPP